MNKNIPILIHNYETKFLKKNIESIGFQVIELKHNKRTHLKENLYVNILAVQLQKISLVQHQLILWQYLTMKMK